MSLVINDSILGRGRFDFRSGRMTYDNDLPPSIWVRLTRVAAAATALAGGAWILWQGSIWTIRKERKRRLKRMARESNDVIERAQLLLAMAASSDPSLGIGIGGFMTNARILSCQRDPNDSNRRIFFASGGWTYQERVLGGMPLYPQPTVPCTPAAPSSEESAARDDWWLALTFGKSAVFNGAMAFIIATTLLEQQQYAAAQPSSSSSNKHTRPPPPPLTFRGRRVVDVCLGTGSLYSSTSDRPKVEIVCEIGTVDPLKLETFQMEHPFVPFDPTSPQLAEVCDFGTHHVLDHFRRHHTVPSKTALPRTLFERKLLDPPPIEGERTIILILEDGLKVALDLTDGFVYGETYVMWKEEKEEEEEEEENTKAASVPSPASSSSSSSSSTSPSSFLSSLWSRVNRFVSSLLSLDFPVTSAPRPTIFYPSDLSDLSPSHLTIGASKVIEKIQKDILINNEHSNERNTQMRMILTKMLRLWQLNQRYLLHRIGDSNRNTDDANHSGGSTNRSPNLSDWQADAYKPQKQGKKRETKSEKARRARKAAEAGAKRDEDHQDEQDESSHAESAALNDVD